MTTGNDDVRDRTTSPPDIALLAKMIDGADLNVLRLAIYQETRDPELAAMRIAHQPIWGGSYIAFVLAPEHHARMRQIALAYLTSDATPSASKPDRQGSRALMELFQGAPVTDAARDYGYEELAFEPMPRAAEWTSRPAPEAVAAFKVILIGAGMSGIAMAVQLERLGIPYEVIERQDAAGGTWALNRYPGARVDIPSANYQYKFEKYYPWKNIYATQAENQDYLAHVARKHGVWNRISFGTELVSAKWDDATALWNLAIRRGDGSEELVSCNVLISASGLFSTPKLPDIPGIDTFEGRVMPTTAWDGSYDHVGKRIAVIGNGSSGAQILPQLAKTAAQVIAFQRTPQWVMGVEGYFDPVPGATRWLCAHVPNYWNWYCYNGYLPTVQLRGLFEHDRAWQEAGGRISERNDRLRDTILDYMQSKLAGRPDLIEKSIPTYAPWGRRLVIDTGWYDALKRDNVLLETAGIDRITPHGIRTCDGREHQVDLIVSAAGFHTSRYLWPVRYEGRGGQTPQALWAKDGPRAYLGLVMPGFPNLFMIYGAPNGQPAGGTVSSWCEIWARYVARALITMIERGIRSIECRRDVFDRFNVDLDAEMSGLIWEQEGVGSYFINEHGRQSNNMPFETDMYYDMLREVDLADYVVEMADGTVAPG